MKGPEHEVQVLSSKLIALFDAFHNVDYALAVEGEIHGHKVGMSGVTVMGGAKNVSLPGGGYGVVFDEHPDRPRWRKWAMGKFSPEDESDANTLREQSKKINIEQFRANLMRKVKCIPKPPNLTQARRALDLYFANAPQFALLTTLMEITHLSKKTKDLAKERWIAANPQSFEAFAPYSCHVLRTVMLYVMGLAHGLIGTRPTNTADLQYLFYLPFCSVFSSGDKFVIEMSKALIKPWQFFISRDELKRDMRAVHTYNHAQSDEERQALAAQYDAGQPDGVFTNPLWHELNEVPWKRPKDDLAPKMSKEEEKALFEQVKFMMDAAKQK